MILTNKTKDILFLQGDIDSPIAKKYLKHYFISLFTTKSQTIEYPCFAFIDRFQQFNILLLIALASLRQKLMESRSGEENSFHSD